MCRPLACCQRRALAENQRNAVILANASMQDKELPGGRAPFCIFGLTFLEGYLNVGCFRLALRKWRQNTQKPSLLKLSPRTIFPTIHRMYPKRILLVCRSFVEQNAHLNVI